jgi:hypothetical protein
MRTLPFLSLLAACGTGKIELGDDTPIGGDTAATTNDADADGHDALSAGGDDCDDADPTVYPGATDTWYDGVDQDCDGASDYDQDGDGVDATAWGADCDDFNPTVFPDAPEGRNTVDDDCDGLVDEDFITSGAIVVSEVMEHPLAASDSDGEWFELQNTTAYDIDVVGWSITSDDGDAITIDRSLLVPAHGVAVLGANDNTLLNGGVTLDYAYDRATMSLGSEDSLFLLLGTSTVFDIEWTAAWGAAEGVSRSLDPDHAAVPDAREASNWCTSSTPLASGDKGTPGSANDECTSIDEDGDGYSTDAGDCDDDDAAVSPRADEVWNGIDDDCSGSIDDGDIDAIATGYVDGPSGSYLSVFSGLGLGDVSGDGTVDLVVGSGLASAYSGGAWVIPGEDIADLGGTVTNYDDAAVTGDTYSYFGATSREMGDVTGDGDTDLVVAGGGYAYYTNEAVAIFAGGTGVSGALTSDDADFVVTGNTGGYGNNTVMTSVDFDGDGVDEIVYGQPYANSGARYSVGRVSIINPVGRIRSALLDDADLVIDGETSADYFGVGLGGADVDDDGYDDLLVGASGADDGATDAGAWYVVSGTSAWTGSLGIGSAASQTIYGETASGMVGYGAPALGDFDDNGHLDLAVGGLAADAAYVFDDLDRLSDELTTGDADLTISGDGPNNFGFALTAGDFDGDGVDDLAVGAPACSTGYYAQPSYWYYAASNDRGELYVFSGPDLGTGTMVASSANATALGEAIGDLLGSVLSGAADIDGDGADDLLVGAPRGGSAGAGRVYVVPGR